MQLTIGYLYGDLMNIYGDTGNIITLVKRAQWRDIDTRVINISTDNQIKNSEIDIYFFGGGQDQQQNLVAKDLQTKKAVLKADIERGVPLLSICGGYQLLGEYYQPFDAEKLEGLSIFPTYTQASHERMIGNIVIEAKNQLFSTKLVGFENHSGKTYLKEGGVPLGKVINGFGNNGEDKTEGCIYKNAIGCYMHGSILPKNPQLADWLLKKALEIKYEKEISLQKLNDEIEHQAHNTAITKYS